MKSVFNVISMAAVLLLANSSSTSQAVVLESAHKTHNTKVYDPAPFKQMFAQIDTEIEQVQRNKDQGVIGRRLASRSDSNKVKISPSRTGPGEKEVR